MNNMLTPYDWQEGIGHRAQFIEGKLAHSAPIVAISHSEGILIATYARQSRKIFEIYDRLAFSAIGHQSDIEAIRTAALDFSSKEGYQRSEAEVTIQRVVSGISAPIKRVFGDFGQTPMVMRGLFAEVNPTPEADLFYQLDYNGDYSILKGSAVIAGHDELEKALHAELKSLDVTAPLDETLSAIWEIYQKTDLWEGSSGFTTENLEDWRQEALIIERSDAREDRFRVLTRNP